jgi:yecA family protein
VNYDQLNEHIEAVGLETGVAESHGMFCGLLCGGGAEPESLWLAQLLQDRDGLDLLVQECGQGLRSLGAETREAIDGPGLGFTPLLPDDERPLAERARALSEWCQGFLYGVGLTGTRDQHLSPETAEALRNLADIVHLDSDVAADSEEDEEAYTELTEFVWVAAMLIYEERAPHVPQAEADS